MTNFATKIDQNLKRKKKKKGNKLKDMSEERQYIACKKQNISNTNKIIRKQQLS